MAMTPQALEAFLVLRPYLPRTTRLTSAYRAPEDQLEVIRQLAASRRMHVPNSMSLQDASSWLGLLKELRGSGVAVNAPEAGHGIAVSPHTKEKVVFDMAGAPLAEIAIGCARAQGMGLVRFRQIKEEPRNRAVHVEVESLSARAVMGLYDDMGFALT